MDTTAKALGLGEATGVELAETRGWRANPDTKKALYDNPSYQVFTAGDTISMAIGQSDNRFSPMQLAVYTAALANRGVRYKATFLNRIISADYQKLLYESKPTVASRLEITDEAYQVYTSGMRLAVSSGSGTAHSALGDYPVAVCAKTGTAQHGSPGSDHASFVCYAPADDPQVAIAIYVEKGALRAAASATSPEPCWTSTSQPPPRTIQSSRKTCWIELKNVWLFLGRCCLKREGRRFDGKCF